MGSKYPILTPKEVISALQKVGFEFKSQRGSHVKYEKGIRTVIIPSIAKLPEERLEVYQHKLA